MSIFWVTFLWFSECFPFLSRDLFGFLGELTGWREIGGEIKGKTTRNVCFFGGGGRFSIAFWGFLSLVCFPGGFLRFFRDGVKKSK